MRNSLEPYRLLGTTRADQSWAGLTIWTTPSPPTSRRPSAANAPNHKALDVSLDIKGKEATGGDVPPAHGAYGLWVPFSSGPRQLFPVQTVAEMVVQVPDEVVLVGTLPQNPGEMFPTLVHQSHGIQSSPTAGASLRRLVFLHAVQLLQLVDYLLPVAAQVVDTTLIKLSDPVKDTSSSQF